MVGGALLNAAASRGGRGAEWGEKNDDGATLTKI